MLALFFVLLFFSRLLSGKYFVGELEYGAKLQSEGWM